MLARSFRLVAARLIPRRPRAKQLVALGGAALGLVAAGCGGSRPAPPQRVAGDGYRFDAPQGWSVHRSRLAVSATSGSQLVQVSRFPLNRPYRPALFAPVARELRVRMGQIAGQTGGTVEQAGSVVAGGVRSHVYRLAVGGHVDEYTFVLVGRREYQLLCRAPKPGTPPCKQLQASFALT